MIQCCWVLFHTLLVNSSWAFFGISFTIHEHYSWIFSEQFTKELMNCSRNVLAYYCSPLYTEGETYRFTSHRSFLCHISFVSVRSVPSVYHAGGQTRDVDPLSGYCWPTVYDAGPTIAQYWVTVSCLTPRCMWASDIDGGQH